MLFFLGKTALTTPVLNLPNAVLDGAWILDVTIESVRLLCFRTLFATLTTGVWIPSEL